MKVYKHIEKHYWIFLLGGVIIGLANPVSGSSLMILPKPILMIMLFFVFLKTDSIDILEKVKNYKLMIYIVSMFMIFIPILLFFSINIFSPRLAVGVLLLTAMPAAVASPTLTDIAKGNIALSMSIVILTSIVAPFTVPLLFWLINIKNLSIDPLTIFTDMALIVFLPMIVAQVAKKFFSQTITATQHLFTSFNIILLFALIYAVIASHHDEILNGSVTLVWQVVFLYLIFIFLHVIGYLIAWKQNREDKIAITIGSAYMNNGMAIVLAASHFEPSILVLMILSELPWSTLLAPFKKITGS